MSDLEQSIATWRKQMLAAGIKAPVPLDELEIHLREEMERRLKSGLDEQSAFESAARQFGPAQTITAEFKKAAGLLNWLGENRQTRINRTFALVWLVLFTKGLMGIVVSLAGLPPNFKFHWAADFIPVFAALVMLCGIAASLLLFGGWLKVLRVIRDQLRVVGRFWHGIGSFDFQRHLPLPDAFAKNSKADFG
jgi:hypothetical protein